MAQRTLTVQAMTLATDYLLGTLVFNSVKPWSSCGVLGSHYLPCHRTRRYIDVPRSAMAGAYSCLSLSSPPQARLGQARRKKLTKALFYGAVLAFLDSLQF